MKRKRGHHKKSKQKQQPTTSNTFVENPDSENPLLDDSENTHSESPMEIQPSPSTAFHQPAKPLQTFPSDRLPLLGGGPGRVKVKLKSTKLLDSMHMQNDDVLEKPGEVVVEKMKDGGARKAGSIKIKASRPLSAIISQTDGSKLQGHGVEPSSGPQAVVDRYKLSYQREHKVSNQKHKRYNEQELNAALVVIKKIMKMDAAEPFNVPVNPIALGIPDYFDIIKTPMDFGTICKNLEQGNIYMNSEDVYKDVQYIWENCYRYNNKGDYVVDLMKRVKKNFMKYWTSAGLYSDQPNKTNDAALDQDSGLQLHREDDHGKEEVHVAGGRMRESIMSKQEIVGAPSLNVSGSIQVDLLAPSSQERLHVKSTFSKYKKRRGHGYNKHKHDCLCAVCVVRRRRREREENAKIVEGQIEISDGNMSQEFRQEETSLENPGSEDASSNSDCSPDLEADVKFEDQGVQVNLGRLQQERKSSEDDLEVEKTVMNEPLEQLEPNGRSGEEANPESQSEDMDVIGFMTQTSIGKGSTPLRQKEEEVQKITQKRHELQERQKQARMYKDIFCEANPSIIKLCGTLFSNARKSPWNGPHSLVRQDTSVNRSGAIHAALAMFMK